MLDKEESSEITKRALGTISSKTEDYDKDAPIMLRDSYIWDLSSEEIKTSSTPTFPRSSEDAAKRNLLSRIGTVIISPSEKTKNRPQVLAALFFFLLTVIIGALYLVFPLMILFSPFISNQPTQIASSLGVVILGELLITLVLLQTTRKRKRVKKILAANKK